VTFAGGLRVARYSWPLYAGAAAGLVVGALVASSSRAPPPLRVAALAGMAIALWFACASLLAFHWIFDRSPLTRWEWIRELGPAPARWVHVNAGLDETHAPIARLFPGSEGREVDIFDPASMTAPTLARARGGREGTGARPGALPVDSGWADAVYVVLAAHEVRDPAAREELFRELRRILAPQGRLVLIEHPRNLAGALAFGPGVLHFLPMAMWSRLAAGNGLRLLEERAMSPFVCVRVLAPDLGGAASGR
jgi:SAM-dependent methyltransferase